jgi:hypothetical protein
MYGLDFWTLSESDEQNLGASEWNVSQKMCGLIQDSGIWRSRCSFELCTLYKEPKLTQAAQLEGLRWAGHVQCVEEEQIFM